MDDKTKTPALSDEQAKEVRRLEQRNKVGDDLVHQVGKFLDAFKNSLSLDNLRLVERYRKIEINIIVQFDIHGMQYIACFQAARGTDGLEDSGGGRELVAAGEAPQSRKGLRRELDV